MFVNIFWNFGFVFILTCNYIASININREINVKYWNDFEDDKDETRKGDVDVWKCIQDKGYVDICTSNLFRQQERVAIINL